MTVHNRKILTRIGIVLGACLVLVGVCFLPELYARYFTKDDISDQAQVAPFVLNSNFEEQSATLELSNEFKDVGDTASFDFQVKNFSGASVSSPGVINAVDLQYTVEVQSYGNLPLVFTVERVDVDATAHGSGSAVYTQYMEASVAQEHTYRVTVTWPDGADSAEYADEIDIVTVTVTCDQQD